MAQAKTTMTRTQLLAAEIFGYSFANYQDHLGIGHARYEKLMPESAIVLERAVRETWPAAKAAAELETSEENAQNLLDAYQRAIAIIDAENPAESFRNAVRFVVRDAFAEGLSSEAAIEKLVLQICYRAADLAYLLDLRGESLSRYSRHLRRDPSVEYYEGYFDEDDA
jgi:hypothetical protein